MCGGGEGKDRGLPDAGKPNYRHLFTCLACSEIPLSLSQIFTFTFIYSSALTAYRYHSQFQNPFTFIYSHTLPAYRNHSHFQNPFQVHSISLSLSFIHLPCLPRDTTHNSKTLSLLFIHLPWLPKDTTHNSKTPFHFHCHLFTCLASLEIPLTISKPFSLSLSFIHLPWLPTDTTHNSKTLFTFTFIYSPALPA